MKCKECKCDIFKDLTSILDDNKVIQCFACQEQYTVTLDEYNNIKIVRELNK